MQQIHVADSSMVAGINFDILTSNGRILPVGLPLTHRISAISISTDLESQQVLRNRATKHGTIPVAYGNSN